MLISNIHQSVNLSQKDSMISILNEYLSLDETNTCIALIESNLDKNTSEQKLIDWLRRLDLTNINYKFKYLKKSIQNSFNEKKFDIDPINIKSKSDDIKMDMLDLFNEMRENKFNINDGYERLFISVLSGYLVKNGILTHMNLKSIYSKIITKTNADKKSLNHFNECVVKLLNSKLSINWDEFNSIYDAEKEDYRQFIEWMEANLNKKHQ